MSNDDISGLLLLSTAASVVFIGFPFGLIPPAIIVGIFFLVKTLNNENAKSVIRPIIAPGKYGKEEEVVIEEIIQQRNEYIEEKGLTVKEDDVFESEPELIDLGPGADEPYVIPLGRILHEGEEVELYQKIAHVGHIFLAGMTRYGKTVKIYDMIHHLIQNHNSEQLQLGFSDAKKISFNIYRNLPHTRWPIATSKQETLWLLKEVERVMFNRLDMFSQFEDVICANIDDYAELTSTVLPRIIIFFDEVADSIEPDSDAEKILTSIAKMGLATGITVVLATQRPTKAGISHEVQSQCATFQCTYMKNSREYQFSQVGKEVYKDMKPEKGLFMVYTPECAPLFTSLWPEYSGWGFVRGKYHDNKALSLTAKGLQTGKDVEKWSDWGYYEEEVEEDDEAHLWGTTSGEKIRAISIYARELGRYPTKEELSKRFSITAVTANKWLQRTY
jgi:hypothetical protein